MRNKYDPLESRNQFCKIYSKATFADFIISDGASGLRFDSAYYCACALNMSLSIYVNAQTSCLLIQDNTAQLLVGCAKPLTICCRQQILKDMSGRT